MKIYLIDPDEMNRSLLGEILREAGHAVDETATVTPLPTDMSHYQGLILDADLCGQQYASLSDLVSWLEQGNFTGNYVFTTTRNPIPLEAKIPDSVRARTLCFHKPGDFEEITDYFYH